MNLCPDIDELLMELVYRWSCVNVAVGSIGGSVIPAARGCSRLREPVQVFACLRSAASSLTSLLLFLFRRRPRALRADDSQAGPGQLRQPGGGRLRTPDVHHGEDEHLNQVGCQVMFGDVMTWLWRRCVSHL